MSITNSDISLVHYLNSIVFLILKFFCFKGTFAEYIVVPRAEIFLVPEHLSITRSRSGRFSVSWLNRIQVILILLTKLNFIYILKLLFSFFKTEQPL